MENPNIKKYTTLWDAPFDTSYAIPIATLPIDSPVVVNIEINNLKRSFDEEKQSNKKQKC